MRLLRTLLIVPALLALLAGGALTFPAAAGAAAPGKSKPGGLDPSFGDGGIVTAAAPATEEPRYSFKISAADGRVYVLDGSLLLAFESDGQVATGFGEGGRVTVASTVTEGVPTDLAIDSQGRLLLVGSARLPDSSTNTNTLFNLKPTEAYVIRLLPDGARDPSFGSNGEVDTEFGFPLPAGATEKLSVHANAIAVDAQDRPLVGATAGVGVNETCSYYGGVGPERFVARLTTTGAFDTTFAGSGRASVKGHGGIESVTPTAGGKLTVIGGECGTPPRYESRGPDLSVFTEGGAANPRAQDVPLGFTYGESILDPAGRVVMIESPPPAGEGAQALALFLPNGSADQGFGRNGRVLLLHGLKPGGALAVDAHSRPIVAGAAKRIALRRFRPDGKLDQSFGPGGKLTAPAPRPSAIAVGTGGRIYTLSPVEASATTAAGIEIARFIPGH